MDLRQPVDGMWMMEKWMGNVGEVEVFAVVTREDGSEVEVVLPARVEIPAGMTRADFSGESGSEGASSVEVRASFQENDGREVTVRIPARVGEV